MSFDETWHFISVSTASKHETHGGPHSMQSGKPTYFHYMRALSMSDSDGKKAVMNLLNTLMCPSFIRIIPFFFCHSVAVSFRICLKMVHVP